MSTTPSQQGDAYGEETAREHARQLYRETLTGNDTLSRTQVAQQFGRSRGWAHRRLEEVLNTTPPRESELGGSSERGDRSFPAQTQQGRAVAWLAFIVGIAASVAANVLHAQLISTASAAWIGAAFWPIAMLLAVEVLTRVEWPTGSTWHTAARYVGTSLVATVAAILSYRHMAGLLQTWGEDSLSAHLGPLAVDGLMITAAAALLTPKR